jgi:hypothetical protein
MMIEFKYNKYVGLKFVLTIQLAFNWTLVKLKIGIAQ